VRLLRSRTTALATTLLALAAAAAPAAATGGRDAPSCAAPAGAGWTSTPAPDLSAYANASFRDGDELLSHALDSVSPQDHWVSSSAAVLRSRDGGCTWSEAVALPEVPTADIPWTRSVHRLERLVAGRTPRGEQRVVATGLAFTGEHVLLRSDEGGAPGSWQAHPAPQMNGNLVALAMAPGNADRLYAAFDRAVVALLEVHVSDDGGRTWSFASSLDLAGQRTAGAVGDSVLAVDPADPDTVLLAAGHSGLVRSTDAGRTFTRLDGPRIGGALALHRDAEGTSTDARIAAFEAVEAVGYFSSDGGRTFTARGTGAPEPFRRATYGSSSDALIAVQGPDNARFADQTGMAIWRWNPAEQEFRDITPTERPVLYDALHDGAGGFVLHGPQGLWTWHGDRPARPAAPAEATVPRGADGSTRLRAAQPPAPAPARLGVPGSLTLEPGEQRTFQARLVVPPRPRDLDLVLLFDTTNSMTGSIDALRADAQRLVDVLAAGGNRARFGLAEFQDYPIPPYGQPLNRPYARLRDLGPVDASLRTALAALSTRDDLDVPTSGLTGLLQVATGAGQRGLPRAPQSEDPNIAAGQGMSFDSDAVKVVVAFGDEPFHDSPGHPGPSLAQALAALRSADVLVAGVSVGGRPAGAGDDLRRVAAGTGALAPRDIDCGDTVLPAGAPLVCEVGQGALRTGPEAPSGRLVDAVSALVDAVPAPALATLTASAPAGLAAAVGPAADVDLRRTSTVTFPVTLACTSASNARVPLVAQVGSEVVARAALPVSCGATPPATAAAAPAAQVPAVAPDAPSAALAVPPAVAPPPVVQVPAPAQAPAGAGSTATAPGAAAGLAVAPGQVEARRTAATIGGGELPLAAVPLAAGTVTTAALAGHLLATRRRAPALARPSRRTEDLL
jgi:hypothetical protein